MSRTLLVGAGFVVVVVAYAVLSQVWVSAEPGWYAALPRPPWQPPDWVFGVIWPLNFLALLAAGVVLARADPVRAGPVLAVLAVAVVFALGWAYLFYVPHALAASAVSLGIAAALTWVLLVLAAGVVGWTGVLLAPYAVWVSLATSLAVWYAVEV
ncbi:tryptophan-rich sensory protein [Nocardioides mesophilus]|uniref:Tryptophan-rich sensory protein n=1 Tax=Nocardioides mesophilus TaxID=433659 RepID=A0A7G9R7B0_9ACTN|nr:TspO/MBR family protein [Nocardioides mesophilus]QNN51485.1 tryptophan-rich sensory protein [Nocardioides mesophilus]